MTSVAPAPGSLPTLAGSSSRALGAYYTPSATADLLARWVLRAAGDRVLEPSVGDGVFLEALVTRDRALGGSARIWGVELAADTYAATLARSLIDPSRAILGDFLAVEPFPLDAVVGNPPYVRLRHLPPDQEERALAVAEKVLGARMEAAGSVWMPFVLHATRFLVPDGRLALVLPYELTYVRYARPLWRHLARCFGRLEVVRVRERLLPQILQEVVLLLADEFGGSTDRITFRAYHSRRDLFAGAPAAERNIAVAEVVAGRRSFLTALLDPAAQRLLDERISLATVPARDLVTFNIGYVCGDKGYFHPDAGTRKAFALPPSSLRPALTSSRRLRGTGLRTSSAPRDAREMLFLPPGGDLTAGERRYLAVGEAAGVPHRYKCRVRDPWYVTPGVRVPDVVVPVFTERPAVLANDEYLVASNSLLCGYLRQGTVDALLTAWYTSLTTLQFEIEIHALGGGVMVLVPGEAGNLRLPVVSPARRHLVRVDRLLRAERIDEAFAAGDAPVLGGILGLTPDDHELIRASTRTLRVWRTSARPDPAVPAGGTSA